MALLDVFEKNGARLSNMDAKYATITLISIDFIPFYHCLISGESIALLISAHSYAFYFFMAILY